MLSYSDHGFLICLTFTVIGHARWLKVCELSFFRRQECDNSVCPVMLHAPSPSVTSHKCNIQRKSNNILLKQIRILIYFTTMPDASIFTYTRCIKTQHASNHTADERPQILSTAWHTADSHSCWSKAVKQCKMPCCNSQCKISAYISNK